VSIPPDSLAKTLADIRDVEGWLSADQAALLWSCASSLPDGAQAVEIGSFRGRSAIVLARAAGGRAEVAAIDPHAGNDRGPQEIRPDAANGDADFAAFNENLVRAGVADAVRHVRLPSAAALGEVGDRIDLLYVDGAHRYAPARDDIARWGARVADGGDLLIHDAFSSVGVTFAQLRLLFAGRDYRYLGRARSLAHYRRERLSKRERAVNLLRQAAQLPWFARNLVVKLALVTGLRPVARALGHRDGPWPY
jgi:hypothetical protein